LRVFARRRHRPGFCFAERARPFLPEAPPSVVCLVSLVLWFFLVTPLADSVLLEKRAALRRRPGFISSIALGFCLPGFARFLPYRAAVEASVFLRNSAAVRRFFRAMRVCAAAAGPVSFLLES
jgi:hypothetical protein